MNQKLSGQSPNFAEYIQQSLRKIITICLKCTAAERLNALHMISSSQSCSSSVLTFTVVRACTHVATFQKIARCCCISKWWIQFIKGHCSGQMCPFCCLCVNLRKRKRCAWLWLFLNWLLLHNAVIHYTNNESANTLPNHYRQKTIQQNMGK